MASNWRYRDATSLMLREWQSLSFFSESLHRFLCHRNWLQTRCEGGKQKHCKKTPILSRVKAYDRAFQEKE